MIGANIKALRRAASLTQAELAEAMEAIGFRWLRQTVAETEAGRRDITLEELVAVAAFFEMPMSGLVVAPGARVMWVGVEVGDRSLTLQEWIHLVEQGRANPLEQAPPSVQRAIDALVGDLPRPWAQPWREEGGDGPRAYLAAREERLNDRSKFPGPIFLWEGDGPLGIGTSIPPWGQSVQITLESGVPYVARDEMEAEHLRAAMATHPELRVISRQEKYRLRRRET